MEIEIINAEGSTYMRAESFTKALEELINAKSNGMVAICEVPKITIITTDMIPDNYMEMSFDEIENIVRRESELQVDQYRFGHPVSDVEKFKAGVIVPDDIMSSYYEMLKQELMKNNGLVPQTK